jgi:glycosyltransferase involved in cell wall biosynthesis
MRSDNLNSLGRKTFWNRLCGAEVTSPRPLRETVSVESEPMRRGDMRILLTGIACQPNAGSEAGVTWNWAWHLSRRNEVWVIAHVAFRQVVEEFLANRPNPNLHFEWVGALGWLPLKPPQDIRFHYVLWLRAALERARRLQAKHQIDVVHHVSFNTVSAPPPFWKLGLPFVWGPVGGGQITPAPLLWCFRRRLLSEVIRTCRVKLLPLLPSLRRAVAKADAVFAVNHETARVLTAAGAAAVPLMLDCALPATLLDTKFLPRHAEDPFVAVWAGRIEPRKGLELVLQAARLVQRRKIHIVVAGDGPGFAEARGIVSRLDLADRVNFLGRLPWDRLQALFGRAHVLIFSSVRDSSGWVGLEAMAQGCPVICLDHQGMGAHLPPEATVKIPVGPARSVVEAIAAAVEALADDRRRLSTMSQAAITFARTQGWENHASTMEACYRSLIAARGMRSRSTG